jgi:hypothetical protein
MRHMMSLLKISEMVKDNFKAVMTRDDEEPNICELLYFTESFDKSF